MTEIQQALVELARKRYVKAFPEQCWNTFPLETAIAAMQKSNEFDVEKYRADYPDLGSSGYDAIDHYMRKGCLESRKLEIKKILDQSPLVSTSANANAGECDDTQLTSESNAALNKAISEEFRNKRSQKLVSIPGMMTEQDKAIYYYYASRYNHADMIDAGCLVGCTSACVLEGSKKAGANSPVIKIFDRFIPDPTTSDWLHTHCGTPKGSEANFRPIYEKHIGEDLTRCEIHEGDFLDSPYVQDKPISFLGLDFCKSPALTDAAIRKFFPALIPGNSILIHQDYIHPWLPHIHISMELLNDYFAPALEGEKANCYAFKLKNKLTADDIERILGAHPEKGQYPEWYKDTERNLELFDKMLSRILYKDSRIQLNLAKAVYLWHMDERPRAMEVYRAPKRKYGDLGYTCTCEQMFIREEENSRAIVTRQSNTATPQSSAPSGITGAERQVWEAHIPSETSFWFPIISGTYANKERCEFMRKFSQPMECAPASLRPYLGTAKRILDVGAGPVSVLGSHLGGKRLEITAIDPLAREYEAEFAKAGYHPLVRTQYGIAEELEKYVEGQFDVVFSRNALDHCFDPVTAINKMLAFCAPGGVVRLENVINEGEHSNYAGIKQYNFMPEGNELIIWNKNGYRKKLSEELVGIFDTFLVTKGPDRWVYVEIGK